jgi:hypothetical protein
MDRRDWHATRRAGTFIVDSMVCGDQVCKSGKGAGLEPTWRDRRSGRHSGGLTGRESQRCQAMPFRVGRVGQRSQAAEIGTHCGVSR